MRNDYQFQQVLDAAHRSAVENSRQQARLSDAMLERYGKSHGDVDADGLIESLDYGNGTRVTVAQVDREMAENGAPKLPAENLTE